MILKIKELPEYAINELEKCAFQGTSIPTRRCVVFIPEQDAVTRIDGDSFDFSEVYGNCELTQVMLDKGEKGPFLITSYQFEKNKRSMEQEAVVQQEHYVA